VKENKENLIFFESWGLFVKKSIMKMSIFCFDIYSFFALRLNNSWGHTIYINMKISKETREKMLSKKNDQKEDPIQIKKMDYKRKKWLL